MKRILVPTDFSEHSEHALRVAAQIAKKHNGEIILLHSIELPHLIGENAQKGENIPEIMFFKNKAIEKLEAQMDADFLDGLEVSEIIKLERVFDSILTLIQKNNIDLIVMGSHGSNGIQEILVGSNTEKVVRNVDVPVLIIKKEMPVFEVNHFVFASDFSKEIKTNFHKVIQFAEKNQAKLHLVYINTPTQFKTTAVAEELLRLFVSDFDIKNFETHIYNDMSVEKGVFNFSKAIQAELIGLSTHGKKGISHFFNGSISESIVNHATLPVITFKV
ncbi:universal stress protein [Flavobacterium branchiophilum]|uniref:Universal stress protein UspA n=1 Tax=Flavobacterium branchiophilum TaxID=55197 RepID=A0A2H3KBJ8_9FLAO|nr:universal stress protein [Flavobacterium branchiophilum]PDS24464.1 universal stress protein UspA [Flavobacterium branchiophilum]